MSRQTDMQLFLADGCKEALLEEKRRFCFLVDKHCMFSYQTASFHDKVQNITMSNSFFMWLWWCPVSMKNLSSIQQQQHFSTPPQEARSVVLPW